MSNKDDRWSALSMKERADLMNMYITNGISDLKEIKKHYNSFGPGGYIERDEYGYPADITPAIVEANYPRENEVWKRADASNADMVQRLKQGSFRVTIPDWEDPRKVATHKMMSAGKYVVGNVQNINGQLFDFTDPKHGFKDPYRAAIDNAIKRGDYVEFDTEGDARYFAEHYKKHYNSFDDGGRKNDSYESEMTYSQANALNKYYGDEGPAFLVPTGTEENPVLSYPEELQASTVKAFNSPDEERNFKVDQYLKELSRRKAENPLADYLAGIVLGVPTAGILQGLMPAAQYASGIQTAGRSIGKNAWKGIKHVGRVIKSPANAKTTIGTIGATLGDLYGTGSAIIGGAEILDKWSSGKFDHQDIPEFVLNLTGTIPAAYATKQSIDYASDLANSLYKSSNATKKLSHFEDPVIAKANSAEQINTVGNAKPIHVDPKVASIYNKQITHQLSSKTLSKLTKAELEGKTKHARTNIDNVEAFKSTFDTTPRIITGYRPYDSNAEEFIKAIDEGRLYHDYNIDLGGFKKEPFLAELSSTKEWKPSKHIKTYIDTLDDIPEVEKLPALRMQENGYVAPIVDLYRRYLARLGYNPNDLSDYDISKLLSHTYNDISSQLTGKTAKQLFYHGVSGKSPKEDYKSSWFSTMFINKPPLSSFDIFKTGITTGNMGRAGAGMNFSTIPVFSGKNSGYNIQPYLIGGVDDVVKSTTLGYSGNIGNHIKDYHINIGYNTKGVSAKEFAHRLIKSLPDESNKLIVDVSEAAQGVIPGYDESKALNVLYRGPMNRVKSIFPHPDRFVLNDDGTVTFIPVDFNDVRHNFKYGGKLLTKRK